MTAGHSAGDHMPTTLPTSASQACLSWYQPSSSTTSCELTVAVLCLLVIMGNNYRVSEKDPLEVFLKKLLGLK